MEKMVADFRNNERRRRKVIGGDLGHALPGNFCLSHS